MLRVAGLGSILIKHWRGQKIDGPAVVTTLIFHDIAKPLTFDINKQAKFVTSPEALESLRGDMNWLKENFGEDEHRALNLIFDQIGLSQNAKRILDNLEWIYSDRLLTEKDDESLLAIYADMRIGPQGILSIDQRMHELNARSPIEDFDNRLVSASRLESFVVDNVDLDLSLVTDNQIEAEIVNLSSYLPNSN